MTNSDTPLSAPAKTSRLQFRTRHLFLLTAFIAISITLLGVIKQTVGYKRATVVISGFDHSFSHGEMIHFNVSYERAFVKSGVRAPQNTTVVDYSKLVGSEHEIRYRSKPILWFPREEPLIIALERVQAEVGRFTSNATQP